MNSVPQEANGIAASMMGMPYSQFPNQAMMGQFANPMLFTMQTMQAMQNYMGGAEGMEMMRRMYDEVKELRDMYMRNTMSEKRMLQETFAKVILNTQSNLLTQQVPPIPQVPFREFYSDAKQHRDLF